LDLEGSQPHAGSLQGRRQLGHAPRHLCSRRSVRADIDNTAAHHHLELEWPSGMAQLQADEIGAHLKQPTTFGQQ
jgi:hypothetical protein